ncbi:hypothetical protein D030_4218A, partial [Vibrio parahaemolyticus AQ3810]
MSYCIIARSSSRASGLVKSRPIIGVFA